MFRDGPLSRRPPEEIRYGTGRCPLGRLLVASSERGIVSILVRDLERLFSGVAPAAAAASPPAAPASAESTPAPDSTSGLDFSKPG